MEKFTPFEPDGMQEFNENENKRIRIEEIRRELMEIQRKILKLKIHHNPDSESEIQRLHLRQSELLAELQQLENE